MDRNSSYTINKYNQHFPQNTIPSMSNSENHTSPGFLQNISYPVTEHNARSTTSSSSNRMNDNFSVKDPYSHHYTSTIPMSSGGAAQVALSLFNNATKSSQTIPTSKGLAPSLNNEETKINSTQHLKTPFVHHSSHFNKTNTEIFDRNSSWANRDGRIYIQENESEIFDSSSQVQKGIKFDSYENIPVDLNGSGAQNISPIENFQSKHIINDYLIHNLKRLNYITPTPVQKNAVPVILEGRDLMACAQTGSGKTAAFLLPIISLMLKHGPPSSLPKSNNFYARKEPAIPVCLVISPTRELSSQIFFESRKFAFRTGIRSCVVYGGQDARFQIFELEKGCDICVATPGRLKDLMERNKIDLRTVRHLVLDEADRMLDMGFYPQMKSIVLQSNMPSSHDGRQTVMFSATFPRDVQQLAGEFLKNYIFLSVGRVGSTNTFINQRLLYAQENKKFFHLIHLLRESSKGLILIFVETKRRADQIENMLIRESFKAVSIHGDKIQAEREEALKYFKEGIRPVMVATDVAARGLDIPNITHVINYDLPNNIDDYVHRIGRTGRAGNQGLATALLNENNKPILKDLFNLLQESQQEIPDWFEHLLGEFNYNNFSKNSQFHSNSFGNRTFKPSNPSQMTTYDIRTYNQQTNYNNTSSMDYFNSSQYVNKNQLTEPNVFTSNQSNSFEEINKILSQLNTNISGAQINKGNYNSTDNLQSFKDKFHPTNDPFVYKNDHFNNSYNKFNRPNNHQNSNFSTTNSNYNRNSDNYKSPFNNQEISSNDLLRQHMSTFNDQLELTNKVFNNFNSLQQNKNNNTFEMNP